MKKCVVIKLILLCVGFLSCVSEAEHRQMLPSLDSDTLLNTGSSYFPYVDENAQDGGWSVP